MNLGWLGWVENNQIPVLRDMGLQIWWIGGGAKGSTCCGVRKDRAGPDSPEAQWCNTSDCEACVNRVDVKTAPPTTASAVGNIRFRCGHEGGNVWNVQAAHRPHRRGGAGVAGWHAGDAVWAVKKCR